MCTLFSTIFLYPKYPCMNTLKGNKIKTIEEGGHVGIYLGGYHGFRVWKLQKIEQIYLFCGTCNGKSWDKYLLNGIPQHKFYDRSDLVRLRGKYTEQCTHCAVEQERKSSICHFYISAWSSHKYLSRKGPKRFGQRGQCGRKGEYSGFYLFTRAACTYKYTYTHNTMNTKDRKHNIKTHYSIAFF